ncbi:unnamed protein product [Acanthoscelides obtectus]|uniref:Uncharacterized protein n=1 Tax=Acanthoscelides obtectus TaxID=200917 RepID=A0A9P0Q1I8_ACAOB|nr:unnamed protein product [Acanthoscelides obtectus]CAK1684305.1 hypothetical protein AOBTE_LOCUS34792 [Acanthoscelides obtectus]
MLVKLLCCLAFPLSSALYYVPQGSICAPRVLYKYKNGEISGEIKLPYENERAVILAITLVFAQRVPNPKVNISMKRSGAQILRDGLLYKLKFDNQEVIPEIIRIVENDQVICEGRPEPPLEVGPYEVGSVPVTIIHRSRFHRGGRSRQLYVDDEPDEIQVQEDWPDIDLPALMYGE